MSELTRSPAVVLDIHVVLDFWHFDDPRTRRLRNQVQARELQVVTCDALDTEINDVLARSTFIHSRDKALQHWRALAVKVKVSQPAPWRCRDPDDQKLLDLAVSSRARALITRDNALLALARRARASALNIVSPEHVAAELNFFRS